MKKMLFLLFGAIFAIAGCADESSSSGNNETCPISSDDFVYERVAQNKYKITLNNENKKQYANNVMWKANNSSNLIGATETDELEPLIIWENGHAQKEVTFYYNNNQCGDVLILKPKSTNSKCDEVKIDYYQDALGSSQYSHTIFIVNYDNNFDMSLKTELAFDNGFTKQKNVNEGQTRHTFNVNDDDISDLIDHSTNIMYADLIITYPDNTKCVKEIQFHIKY